MKVRRCLFVAALCASIIPATSTAKPASAATPADGFTDTIVTGFDRATAVEWLPTDQIAVLEQRSGRVLVGGPDRAFVTALTLRVCTESERGLLGLTADPAFLGNRYVYIYYTAVVEDGCVNRVSRFTLVGELIDPASELVLLDNIPATGGSHNGGDIDIDGEGNLLVSIGDAGRDPRGDSGKGGENDAAQDLSLLSGKIVRITLDGQPAPGNPFVGAGSSRCAVSGIDASRSTRCQEIFAWGLRNPFRIAVDRNDSAGRFFINDVGQNTFEEINKGVAGSDYGWPVREGPCPQGETPPCSGSTHRAPITEYQHDVGSYITAGAFVPNGLWPAQYDDAYLFGDGGSGNIWLRTRRGDVDFGAPFVTGAVGLTDMTFGFDADGVMVLYYVQVGGGLRMIRPDGVGPSPVVSGLKFLPITPFRAFDSAENSAGVGRVLNGSTRQVELSPPAGTRGALVNLTFGATAGPGYLRTWASRSARPETSALNADSANTTAANANMVAVGDDGTFIVESSTTARVVVDVLAWLVDTGGTSKDGRFEPAAQIRLIDTRLPADEELNSASTNRYRRSPDRIDFDVLGGGNWALPDDGTVGAIMVSVATIGRPDVGGFVTGHEGGSVWPGTSNVNVAARDVRANMVLIPLGDDIDATLTMIDVQDVAIDLLGYVTTSAAPRTDAGLIRLFQPNRILDTRVDERCGRIEPDEPCRLSIGGPGNDTSPGPFHPGGLFQNVTVTRTAGPGFLTVDSGNDVSSVNFTGPGQTRAAMTFVEFNLVLAPQAYASSASTDLVIDNFAYVQPS